jgi:hypothetical protein
MFELASKYASISSSSKLFQDFDDISFHFFIFRMISVNKDSNIDSEIAQKTHWFCKLLVLWQCIYYVSDSALTLLLKILSSFFKIVSGF